MFSVCDSGNSGSEVGKISENRIAHWAGKADPAEFIRQSRFVEHIKPSNCLVHRISVRGS